MNRYLFLFRKYFNLTVFSILGFLLIAISVRGVADFLWWQKPENIEMQRIAPVMHFCHWESLITPGFFVFVYFLISILLMFFLKKSNKQNIIVLMVDFLIVLLLIPILHWLEAYCFTFLFG